MKQVVLSQYGGPEVLTVVDTEIPEPKAGEVLIKIEAIGVNYADTLRRRNLYFQPTPLPYVLGSEAVGQIVKLGEGVTTPFDLGARVLAILPMGGGYGQYVVAQAMYCVPLPPHIDSLRATAIFVQGTTAQLMVSQVARPLQGKTVLISAASGGVGSLLVQLAKMNGARVIAAGSSDEKLKLAASLGADVCINYSTPDWHTQVKAATDGKGVDISFEMVGGDVYDESVRSLAMGGQVIIYGCASGIQGRIHPEYFVDENLTQSGFNLAYFITQRMSDWQAALGAVIGLLAEGRLKVETSHVFSLVEAAEAHRQVEARKTTGKVILTID
ncbi:MAG: zinc-binding dehydrogenase [Cytophagales bacterium]|nr:zinc-binding dehydrogenase [Cytophagales bacterium]